MVHIFPPFIKIPSWHRVQLIIGGVENPWMGFKKEEKDIVPTKEKFL